MPCALRNSSLIFTICLLFVANTKIGAAPAQTKSQPPASTDKPASPNAESTKPATDYEEIPGDELEEAAVRLDLSHSSPLIQKLYEATRETKEQAILDLLTEAKQLLADGADVKAIDQYGRTALHWTVFGSSYSTKSRVIVSYEQIADQLIQHGVDINREDVY